MEITCDVLIDLILAAPSVVAWSESERASMRDILHYMARTPGWTAYDDYIARQFAPLPLHIQKYGWMLARTLRTKMDYLMTTEQTAPK